MVAFEREIFSLTLSRPPSYYFPFFFMIVTLSICVNLIPIVPLIPLTWSLFTFDASIGVKCLCRWYCASSLHSKHEPTQTPDSSTTPSLLALRLYPTIVLYIAVYARDRIRSNETTTKYIDQIKNLKNQNDWLNELQLRLGCCRIILHWYIFVIVCYCVLVYWIWMSMKVRNCKWLRRVCWIGGEQIRPPIW